MLVSFSNTHDTLKPPQDASKKDAQSCSPKCQEPSTMAVYLGLFWPFFHLLYVFKEVEKKGWDFAQVYKNHQTKEDLQLESQLPKHVICRANRTIPHWYLLEFCSVQIESFVIDYLHWSFIMPWGTSMLLPLFQKCFGLFLKPLACEMTATQMWPTSKRHWSMGSNGLWGRHFYGSENASTLLCRDLHQQGQPQEGYMKHKVLRWFLISMAQWL